MSLEWSLDSEEWICINLLGCLDGEKDNMILSEYK